MADIGESRNTALKRLHAMEHKFKKNEHLETEYKTFMQEYHQLGHMEAINASEQNKLCFLPHHAVFKPTSTTTKIRVVFDASSKTSNNKSLNDNLLVGPKTQKDLFDTLITFRMHAVAFVGDIEKMYRQILMHKQDRKLQCVLWRESEVGEVKAYSLNTVTYDTAAASFLATRTLLQVALDNMESFPAAAQMIKNNFYVDDLMGCTETAQEADQLKNEISQLLKSAGFHIRKWSSNTTFFINNVPEADRAANSQAQIQHASTVSTLGLSWDTSGDNFGFSVQLSSFPHNVTKRSMLSEVSKIYDPLGWIAPIVVSLKIFMQKLWLKGLQWDEKLATGELDQWIILRQHITTILKIKICRWLGYSRGQMVQLHGFADASEQDYAAAVYIKVQTANNEVQTHLITSKTRVAPVKQISLPRLELCAAHLLSKLLIKIQNILNIPNAEIFVWTDSMIVLACRWKSFIANRTSAIISVVPAEKWRHIRSQQNPAYMATRGMQTEQLVNNNLWWHDPDALKEEHAPRTFKMKLPANINLEERKKIVSNLVSTDATNSFDIIGFHNAVR